MGEWQPIETVPLDGSWVWLLGWDGSDFESENRPRLDWAIRVRTRWVQPRDEQSFEPVGDGLYRPYSIPAEGFWQDVPGQLEYVYAWQPYEEPSISQDDPVLNVSPIDTRGDGFVQLYRARKSKPAPPTDRTALQGENGK